MIKFLLADKCLLAKDASNVSRSATMFYVQNRDFLLFLFYAKWGSI